MKVVKIPKIKTTYCAHTIFLRFNLLSTKFIASPIKPTNSTEKKATIPKKVKSRYMLNCLTKKIERNTNNVTRPNCVMIVVAANILCDLPIKYNKQIYTNTDKIKLIQNDKDG